MDEKEPQLTRDIEFLYEVGSLRNIPRAWEQMVGMRCATDLEHTMRVIWLSLVIARREGIKDEEKVIKMGMVHDVGETRTGDQHYVGRVYVNADEDRAARDLFFGTILKDFYTDILKEYEARESIEAKIVKDADNLDIDLELRELEERGSKLPKKFEANRRLVRDKKLYTQSAKDLWDTLDQVDVSQWHLAANKWVKMPNAGT